MPAHRPSIEIARDKARKFLNSPLSEYISPDLLGQHLSEDCESDITVELTPESFSKGELHFQPTGLNPVNVTMKDTLGIVAHHIFHDPFILNSTRAAAIKKYPEEYVKHTNLSDKILGEELGLQIPVFITYGVFMKELALLADDGTRPDPDVLRETITILQRMIAVCKNHHVESIPQDQSGTELEYQHYKPRANILVTMLSIQPADRAKKPDYMPEALYRRIRKLGDIRDEQLREDTRLELVDETETLLHDKKPMQGATYQREFDKFGEVSSIFAFKADMMQPILNHAIDIAKTLGIDTRSRNRGG